MKLSDADNDIRKPRKELEQRNSALLEMLDDLLDYMLRECNDIMLCSKCIYRPTDSNFDCDNDVDENPGMCRTGVMAFYENKYGGIKDSDNVIVSEHEEEHHEIREFDPVDDYFVQRDREIEDEYIPWSSREEYE